MKKLICALLILAVCSSSVAVVNVPDNVSFSTTFCNNSIALKIVCDGPTVSRGSYVSSVASSVASSSTANSSVTTSSSTVTSSSVATSSSSTPGGTLAATSNVTATPTGTTTIDITWDKANYPQATGFAVMRSVSDGQEIDWNHVGTTLATADGYSDTGLSANTQYIYSVYPIRSSGSYNYEMAIAVTLSPSANTVVVTNDAQLIAAANNNAITDIRLAAGTYTDAIDVFSGKNRQANKLTVRADDPNNRPQLNQVAFDLGGSSGIRFYHLDIAAAGGDRIFSETQGSNTLAGSLVNCSFAYNTITGIPQSVTAPANPNYWSDLAYMFDLANYYNSGNTIFGNTGTWVRQFLDVRSNGHQFIANNTAEFWYYDFARVLGQPNEGRVAGQTYFIRNAAIDNVSVYEEIDNANEPHADMIQVFSTGGTSPIVNDIFFSQNYTTQRVSQLRATQFQAHLMQSKMVNVFYHENMFFALSSHCLWFMSGAEEVGIDYHSCGSHNGGSQGSVRFVNPTTHVKIANSVIPWGETNGATGAQSEIEKINFQNLKYNAAASTTLFNGPLGDTTPDTVFDILKTTPPYATAGALTQEGEFRAAMHFPSAPRDLSVTSGSGSFVVSSFSAPDLNSPVQKFLGGNTYTYDVRYANTGSSSWTVVTGVSSGQTVTGVSSGVKDVQIRAVNSSGSGVWTNNTSVTIN